MKSTTLVSAALCALAAAIPASDAGGLPAASPGILGYLDAQTGAFRPLATPEAVTATTSAAGSISVNAHIFLQSKSVNEDKITCIATAEVRDSAGVITEQASTTATPEGLLIAICEVTIPYEWQLASAATDMITLTLEITTPGRSSTRPVATFKIPASSASFSVTAAM
jgi:hypothetical protein